MHSPASPSTAPRTRPLDDAIRAIPSAWFHPSPLIYWVDLAVSAGLGWSAFIVAVRTGSWTRLGALLIATLALYRAVLFIHEITHLSKRELRGFAFAWNAIVGVPFLLPSFLYEQVHTDHHRQRVYGTTGDPEYVPYSRRSPAVMIGSAIASLFVPVALVIRFGMLAPLSWPFARARQLVERHASALVINHQYVRRAPISAAGRLQEIGAAAVVWTVVVLLWRGALPLSAVALWFVVGGAVSAVNAIRTLTAHRYDEEAEELTMIEQLLDSCTIDGSPRRTTAIATLVGLLRALVAPVGLRFHALHHWIPRLPYHNLGRAHRLLTKTLAADAPYHGTVESGFAPALRALWTRARAGQRSSR